MCALVIFRNILYLLLLLNAVFITAEEHEDYSFNDNQESDRNYIYEVSESNAPNKNPENNLDNLLLFEMKNIENNVNSKMADMALDIKTLLDTTKTVNFRLDYLSSRLDILSYKLNDLNKETKNTKSDVKTNVTMQIQTSSLEQNKISEAVQHLKQAILVIQNTTVNNNQIITKFINNNDQCCNPNKEDKCNSNASPFCNIIVPNSIKAAANTSIWQFEKTPAKDELDLFLERKTGCKYVPRGILPRQVYELAKKSTYNGTSWELRFAVRAEKGVEINLWWSKAMDYSFGIGYEDNKVTNLYKFDGWVHQQSMSTPNILSRERYTPFYFRVEGGILTFGKLCDTCSPILIQNISIQSGTSITMQFYPWTNYGAKILVCPVI